MTDRKKRSYISSTSDLESSIDTSNTSTPKANQTDKKEKKLSKTQKLKKAKLEQKETELSLEMSSKSMETQLKEINDKLSNMLTKNDKSFIKDMIKDTMLELKDSLLAPVIKRIEVLEGELHDKEIENGKLKKELNDLKDTVTKTQDQITVNKTSIKTEEIKRAEKINNHEQYSRVNNIRITALPGDQKYENAYQTSQKVLKMLNDKLKVNMPFQEIDISHRLGTYEEGSNRRVIVRFVRRQTKTHIMSLKKNLKGTGMSMFDDLTPTNSKVLASARKKRPTEVDQAWYTNGKIFVKWKSDSSVEKLSYKDYDDWLSLKWPEEEGTAM